MGDITRLEMKVEELEEEAGPLAPQVLTENLLSLGAKRACACCGGPAGLGAVCVTEKLRFFQPPLQDLSWTN
jgi:hypothetical protein